MNATLDQFNMHDLRLRDDVMRRVRTIHFIRTIATAEVLTAIAFAASVIAAVLVIHLGHILENMSHLSVTAYPLYIYSSFVHTNIVVQAITVVATGAGIWLVIDRARYIPFVRGFSRRATV